MTVELENTLPIIDLAAYLSSGNIELALEECKKLAQALHEYGAFIIKDPRVTEEHNDAFLNTMERYFSQSREEKMADVRAELSYQVGATPEGIEIPRCFKDSSCLSFIETLEEKPHFPTSPDPKWRFFWSIGSRPENTAFPELNSQVVLPKAFPDWADVMNKWGNLMLEAVKTSVEMAALGFGLDKDTFTSRMENGPHLLAPTGSDLNLHNKVGTIFAGFHYDLGFMTIHGKSRFPGLFIWTRSGKKIKVSVPNGCLLVQAGKEMEILTGGYVQAGYHEVVVIPETLVAIEKAKDENRPCWRVSSTLFAHIQSDKILEPLPLNIFRTEDSLKKYIPITAGGHVLKELSATNMTKTK